MPHVDQPLVEISGITVASDDVDATREAWCRLAGAQDTPALVVGGIAVGIGPSMGGPQGLTGVTIACEDVVETVRLLERRGLTSTRGTVGVAGLAWRLAGMSGAFVVDDAGDIDGVDHVVVSTDHPERAVALYGGRLGLDLRLDRTMTEHGMRGLFFALGPTVVEVISKVDESGRPLTWGEGGTRDEDSYAGLAWRVGDVDATRRRLLDAGAEVSSVRAGRKSGTRVATVRDPALTVSTLLVGPT